MIADMMTAMIQKKWASDVLTPLSGEASSPSVAIPVIPPFRRRRLTLLRRDRKVKRWGAARAVSAQHQPCLGEPFKPLVARSEAHTSELQSLMRISFAVFCLTKNNIKNI